MTDTMSCTEFYDDIGIAERINRQLEAISMESSGSYDIAATVESVSVYEFRLDEAILRVQDVDVIRFSEDSAIEDQTVDIKQIRKGTMDRKVGICSAVGVVSGRELVERGTYIEGNPRVLVEDLAKTTQVSVRVDGRFVFKRGCAYGVRLVYDVPMDGDGERMFFCGAIQPSDYESIRRAVEVERVRKEVAVVVWSRVLNGFVTWYFDGCAPCYRPQPVQAVFDARHRAWISERSFFGSVPDRRRASYFGVFVEGIGHGA
jgi:hypothetical protein